MLRRVVHLLFAWWELSESEYANADEKIPLLFFHLITSDFSVSCNCAMMSESELRSTAFSTVGMIRHKLFQSPILHAIFMLLIEML